MSANEILWCIVGLFYLLPFTICVICLITIIFNKQFAATFEMYKVGQAFLLLAISVLPLFNIYVASVVLIDSVLKDFFNKNLHDYE